MNNLKWMGHTTTILEIQKSLHEDSNYCDVNISCEGRLFRSHRFLLCSSSDYFKNIFDTVPNDKESMIIIPDIKENIFENILCFIYTGEVNVSSNNLSDFLETINFLGIRSEITFDCHLNKSKISKNYDTESETQITSVKTSSEVSQVIEKNFEEYLEVYNEEEKIEQFAIEPMDSSESNSDYILAENADNSFVLNHEPKSIQNASISKDSSIIQFVENVKNENESYKDYESDFGDKKIISIKPKTNSNIFDTEQARNEAFDNAVDAVINGGMSLQKAAAKYNISKTVLWRRVKRCSSYKKEREHPMLSLAMEKLEKGESLKNISQTLNIPISTLHRHKVRLLQEGRLPNHVQFKKRGSKHNLKERLKKAIEACQCGMSQNHAATVFGVPKSTLWRHLQKKVSYKKEPEEIDNTV